MYQTIEGIAEYLEVDIAYVLYLMRVYNILCKHKKEYKKRSH